MKTLFLVIHIVVAFGLISLILLQTGKGGLGRSFGGDVVYRSKRGAEKIVFYGTIIFGFLFFVTSIVNYFIR
jgi:protein translocase SecG subunit